jgi:hypothetical protein
VVVVLPLGAGDADDRQGGRGLAVEFRGEIGHGGAGVGRGDVGHAARRAQTVLVEDGDGAAPHGFLGVEAAVGLLAGQGAKQETRPHGARIVGEPGDFRRGGAIPQADGGRRRQQAAQFHRPRAMAVPGHGSPSRTFW